MNNTNKTECRKLFRELTEDELLIGCDYAEENGCLCRSSLTGREALAKVNVAYLKFASAWQIDVLRSRLPSYQHTVGPSVDGNDFSSIRRRFLFEKKSLELLVTLLCGKDKVITYVSHFTMRADRHVPPTAYWQGHRDPQLLVWQIRESAGEYANYASNLLGGDLPMRLDLENHSPTGLEWGYGGSGPAQLALAILADALDDDERALGLYQTFKNQVIARLDRNAWKITREQVMTWVEAQEKEYGRAK